MSNERKVKPRSKAQINKPISAERIVGRATRLKEAIEKNKARGNMEKVAELEKSLAKYREMAKKAREDLAGV